MSTTLNAVTMPDPTGCSCRYMRCGELVQMAGGAHAVRTTTTNAYYRIWTVQWEGVTTTQLSSITTAFTAAMKSKVGFTGPDTSSSVDVFTYGEPEVIPLGHDGAAWHYDVNLQLVEATPV